MESVNKILRDEMIKHQVGLLRLSSAITAKLVTLLNRTEDDILSQLSTKLGNVRLNAVLAGVRDTLDAARSDQYEMLTKELTGLANYEPKFVKTLLQGQIPVKLNMTTPSTDMLASIVISKPFQGKLLKEWVEDLSDSRRKLIRDAVRMGMVEGQTVDQIAKRIRGTRALQYKDGLMEINRRGAQAMVRTAVNHTATAARDLTYAKNQDVIKAVQWISTLDHRTTPICKALDGKTFPVDEGPRPPAHINCRSTIAPVVKSWRELGFDIDEAPESTRASFDGQVPESTTYNEWLKGQTPEFQDSILGPGRGELFRQGVPVDKFVDMESGRPFTLKELSQMDGLKVPVGTKIQQVDNFIPYSVDKYAPIPERKIGPKTLKKANAQGLIDSKTGDYQNYYTPAMQVAYNEGFAGRSLQDAEVVKGIRYGKSPDMGISYNFAENRSEKGLSLAQEYGKKEIGSSMWFKDRKAYEYEGLKVGTGSDGETIIIPFHVEYLD